MFSQGAQQSQHGPVPDARDQPCVEENDGGAPGWTGVLGDQEGPENASGDDGSDGDGDEDVEEDADPEDLILPDGDAHIPTHPCSMDIPEEWQSNVTSFCCEKSAINAVNCFQRTNKCILGYKRTVKPNPEKKVKGRLNFSCIHGLDHFRKGTHPRPKTRKKQRVNYVACQMKININQQLDGLWILRSFQDQHTNPAGEPAHLTGIDVFKSSRKAKELVDKEALQMLKEFKSVNAPISAIAARLSDKFGVNYSRQDIANRINNKLGALLSESDMCNVNTFLDEIIDGGGEVYAKYKENSDKCRVLIIMTEYQKVDLNLSRPKVFINDTTFGTNAENFKVNFNVKHFRNPS